jgi:hypothetical protein
MLTMRKVSLIITVLHGWYKSVPNVLIRYTIKHDHET